MLDKLATVEKSLIVRILGEVDDDLKAEINPKLAACYRLWEQAGRDPLIGLSFVIWKSQEFMQAPDKID